MIIYSSIFRVTDATILADYVTSGTQGNFRQFTQNIIDLLLRETENGQCPLSEGGRKTFVHENDQMFFCGGSECLTSFFWDLEAEKKDGNDVSSLPHYCQLFRKNGIVLLCISDDISKGKQSVNFYFLEAVLKEFTAIHSKQSIRKASPNSYSKSFLPKFRSLTYEYNTTDADMDTKIDSLHTHIEDLKNIMGYNIQLVMKREEKIQDLLTTATQLEQDAAIFHKRSTLTKKEAKKNDFQYTKILVVCFGSAVLAGIIFYLAKR